MGPMKIKAIVPRDHRIEISLPLEVPEGPVDLEIHVAPAGGASPGTGPDRMRDLLAGLREFRKQFDGGSIRLSDAVLEIRREEG